MSWGWIGVDLDGTLAHHGGEWNPYRVGRPVPLMLERVKKMLAAGMEVKIVTARATPGADGKPDPAVIYAIQLWCERHLGKRLEVTNQKDYGMLELWDDRAVQVVSNTGRRVDGEPDPCCYNSKCEKCKELL